MSEQIIMQRLLRVNDIMLKQSTAKDRPNLKQQLEEQRALLDMLKPYLKQ
jgi:hypothetical protein